MYIALPLETLLIWSEIECRTRALRMSLHIVSHHRRGHSEWIGINQSMCDVHVLAVVFCVFECGYNCNLRVCDFVAIFETFMIRHWPCL